MPLLFLSLAFIGRNSMEIYLLHSFFVMIFKEVGVYMKSLNSLVTCVTFQIVYSFVLSVIAITLSILIANFLKGSSILKKYIRIMKKHLYAIKSGLTWVLVNSLLSNFPSIRMRNLGLRLVGVQMTKNVRFYQGFHVRCPKKIKIEDGVSIGPKVLLDGRKGL